MKYVFICSPYRPIGKDLETELKNNIDQAKRACRLAVSRGLIPLAPHLYFDDNDPQERKFGQQVGKEWMRCVSEVWVVGDRISSGMEEELKLARLWSIPIKKVKFHNEQEKLYPDRNTVEQLRKEYPAGCRVKLLKMVDIRSGRLVQRNGSPCGRYRFHLCPVGHRQRTECRLRCGSVRKDLRRLWLPLFSYETTALCFSYIFLF